MKISITSSVHMSIFHLKTSVIFFQNMTLTINQIWIDFL